LSISAKNKSVQGIGGFCIERLRVPVTCLNPAGMH